MSDDAYDLAHRLARALADSEEHRTYQAAYQRLAASPTALEMVTEFGRKAMQAQAAELVGEPLPPEQVAEMQRLGALIALHADAGAYLLAEARLGRLLADVQKILADSLPDWYRHLEALARGPTRPRQEPSGGGGGAAGGTGATDPGETRPEQGSVVL